VNKDHEKPIDITGGDLDTILITGIYKADNIQNAPVDVPCVVKVLGFTEGNTPKIEQVFIPREGKTLCRWLSYGGWGVWYFLNENDLWEVYKNE
jgi:hypothetical protein